MKAFQLKDFMAGRDGDIFKNARPKMPGMIVRSYARRVVNLSPKHPIIIAAEIQNV
jgi:hypothetical protein